MPSPVGWAVKFAFSPSGRKVIKNAVRTVRSEEGRKLIAQARRAATSPEGRRLIEEAKRVGKTAGQAANRQRTERVSTHCASGCARRNHGFRRQLDSTPPLATHRPNAEGVPSPHQRPPDRPCAACDHTNSLCVTSTPPTMTSRSLSPASQVAHRSRDAVNEFSETCAEPRAWAPATVCFTLFVLEHDRSF